MAEAARIQPRLLSANQAALYLGLSKGSLGNVPVRPLKIGHRSLYDREALDNWLDGLSGLKADSHANDEFAQWEREHGHGAA